MYDQIARNKRDSVLLVAIIVAVLLTLGFAIGVAYFRTYTAGLGLLGVFGVVAIVWSLVGYYGGSGIVLAASRAQRVTREQAPILWDVIEEMSIAAGIPMPAVYVINDPAPNAFATGRDPQHASVAVTAGLLQMMSRDELQGVIAHEMSHVRNFDIRFAMLVGVLVGMIALIADFFLRSTLFGGFGRRDSNNNGGIGVIFFLIAIVLAILAPFFALMVQMAISRHREYLADASGVELTRNPLGLAHALQKIAGDPRSAAGGDAGHGAPLHRQPAQGQEAQGVGGAVRHAPADPEAHRHPAGHGARRPGCPRDAASSRLPGRAAAAYAGSSQPELAGSQAVLERLAVVGVARRHGQGQAGRPQGAGHVAQLEQAAREREVGVVVGGCAAQEFLELLRRAFVPGEGVVRTPQRLADGVLVGGQQQGSLEVHGRLPGVSLGEKAAPRLKEVVGAGALGVLVGRPAAGLSAGAESI